MQEGRSSVAFAGDSAMSPLDAAWETIRLGLRRDCGARTFDGWLKPAELGAFDPELGSLDLVMPIGFAAISASAFSLRGKPPFRSSARFGSSLAKVAPSPRPCSFWTTNQPRLRASRRRRRTRVPISTRATAF